MSLIASFDIPIGSMALTVPAGAKKVPGILWDGLALAALLDDHGYQTVAREQLTRLDAWLRIPDPVALQWPGETQARPKGRKLLDGIENGDTSLRWYVVRTATRQEFRAEDGLIEAGFPVYVPRLVRWNRLANRKVRVEQALLAGYLFVGVCPDKDDKERHDEELQQIVGIDGVHSLLRIRQGFPAIAAPFREVWKIMDQELKGEFDKTRKGKARPVPNPGDSVKVIAGSFQGFPAQFVKRRPDQRIELLMNMFGRWSTMVMRPEQVDGFTEEED